MGHIINEEHINKTTWDIVFLENMAHSISEIKYSYTKYWTYY